MNGKEKNEEVSKFFSENLKNYWAKIPPKERSKRAKKMRQAGNPNRWANLTPEHRRELALKMVASRMAKKIRKFTVKSS